MKKHLYITLVSLLSLLIVYTGVGVTVMHCLHHSEALTVTVHQYDGERCHNTASKCMVVTESRLQPTLTAHNISFDFNVLQPLLFVNDCTRIIPQQVITLLTKQIADVMPHGPPLAYLHFIRILII